MSTSTSCHETVQLKPGLSVLVTGGSGFIGSHLVDSLLAGGARVRVLDNFSTGRRANLAHCQDQIELIEGDIRDPAICRTACRDIEIVFHQAALGSVPRSLEDPATTIAVNVCGTTNVFTAARDSGVQRIVYASSSSVYGSSTTLPKREGEEGHPLSPYAASKHMNEDTAAVFSRCFDLELIGLRYFNIFGPRQRPDSPYAAVIPRFFNALLEGSSVTIYGDGKQSRDFTAVADAVAANLLAATALSAAAAPENASYNVAGGRRVTLLELAAIVSEIVGHSPQPDHQPPRFGDVRHSLADLERARRLLLFEPRVSIAEGLALCHDYYRELFARAEA